VQYGRRVVQVFGRKQAGTFHWLLVTESEAGDRQRLQVPTTARDAATALRALATFVRQRNDIDGLHRRVRVREERSDGTHDRPEWADKLKQLLDA
jgi:hypothetical protein